MRLRLNSYVLPYHLKTPIPALFFCTSLEVYAKSGKVLLHYFHETVKLYYISLVRFDPVRLAIASEIDIIGGMRFQLAV